MRKRTLVRILLFAFATLSMSAALACSGNEKAKADSISAPNSPIPKPEPTVSVPLPTLIPQPTVTTRLLTLSSANLLGSQDVPSGFTLATIGVLTKNPTTKSSLLADPSNFTACGPGPDLSLDVGFRRGPTFPALGETLEAFTSVDLAQAALKKAAARAISCTKGDSSTGISSVLVEAWPVPGDLGDEGQAFRVALGQKTGELNFGYVVLVRRANVLASIFYMNRPGSDDSDLVLLSVRAAVKKIDSGADKGQ